VRIDSLRAIQCVPFAGQKEMPIEMLKADPPVVLQSWQIARLNRSSYSITHSFIIHKRFKHTDADITDKGNETTPADLRIRPVADLAKDRTLL